MRLIRYDDGRIGVLVDDEYFVDATDAVAAEPGRWPPTDMVRLIADFARFRTPLLQLAEQGERTALSSVTLDCPIIWPNKIIAFPANYDAHIHEMKDGLVSRFKASGQGFFLKANSSLSGPADPIVLPPIPGREVHHEAELAIIIGKEGRSIARDQAFDHIFGYSCLLDIVVRGKEERVMRKSFDSFCPMGPWITTSEDVDGPDGLDISLHVNGALRQKANTRDLIVDIPSMIEMASSVMTLCPGDIIATGTPAGVGPIADGDRIDISIAQVGSMRIRAAQGRIGMHSVWDKPAD